jgi:hypothetical protein
MQLGSMILALTGASAPARASGAPCDGVRVRSAQDLAPEWADAVRVLIAQLPPVPESACPAVTLSLEPAPRGGARLSAMAADGRYAERAVARPGVLAATALGLVASIPGESSAEPPAAAVRDEAGLAPTEAPTATPPRHAAPGAPLTVSPPPQRVELWLGMAIGARLGEPSPLEMLDVEARADVIAAHWIASLSLRYAPSLGPDGSDFIYEEIVFGLGVGRRIPVGRGAFDLSIVPALASMNLQWNLDEGEPQSGSESALRLGLSARWSAPVGGAWQFTVTADGDVAPTYLEHPTAQLGSGAPTLPIWTAGLRVGASGALF